MTNREYLASLSNEELAVSFQFCECPYGQLWRAMQVSKGNMVCERDEIVKTCKVYTPEIHAQCKRICTKCKVDWLNSEYKPE